jgi:hypothetical protein
MTKLTLSVCKSFKNSGRYSIHKENTSKHWKHYFIEDYFDEDEISFGSEWVSSIKAVFLKRKQLYKRQFICPDCGDVTEQFVPKNTDEMPCAKCNDDE